MLLIATQAIQGSICRANTIQIKDTEKTLLFSYKSNYYVMTKDSLYFSTDGNNWNGQRNPIEMRNLDFLFLEADSCGYFYKAGGGAVYTFNGIHVHKVAECYDLRSNYWSFDIIHDGEVVKMMGYGLFTLKNNIIYYDRKKKEWESIITSTPINQKPQERMSPMGQYSNDEAFICKGNSINNEKEFGERIHTELNDVWKFNFKEYKWTFLGKILSPMQLNDHIKIENYKGKILLFKKEMFGDYGKILVVDLKANTISTIKTKNTAVFTDIKNSNSLNNGIFNNKTNKFLLLIDKEDGYSSPTVFDENYLMDKTEKVAKFYSKPLQSGFYVLIIFMILSMSLIVFLWIKKNSKTTNGLKLHTKINYGLTDMQNLLNIEEFSLLEIILKNYPDPVQYPDLMQIYDSSYTYETQIKRLRFALESLEYKLQKNLKVSYKVLISRKNDQDKRIKEIMLNPEH